MSPPPLPLLQLMLITALCTFNPKVTGTPRHEFGSLRPTERLVEFEREPFNFITVSNPLGLSPEV